MGGLGNQLFQIYTLLATSLRQRKPFRLQDSKTLTHGTVRNTYWDTLLAGLKPFLCNPTLLNFTLYREPVFRYTEIPCFTEDVKLLGYFQSEKYFHEYRDVIFRLLNFQENIASARQEHPEFFQENPVSLHFRITGYKEISDYHPLCKKEYYQAAIKEMGASRRYLIFCQPEDRETVQELISELTSNAIFVPDNIPDWKQMLLMASCKSHIIANSTFSWWGAYLSGESSKVIYPKVWFGPAAGSDASDLPLSCWIGL
jgi:hypothetical protein